MSHYFFFSSRRRHTTLQGDWSSDVCSSDLVAGLVEDRLAGALEGLPVGDRQGLPVLVGDGDLHLLRQQVVEVDLGRLDDVLRSEERRVGREGRSRWWRQDSTGEAIGAEVRG